MLQHVQHQDQIKSPGWLKIPVEWLAVDSFSPGAVGRQRRFVGFDAEDLAKASKTGEQQAVAAAYVKDIRGAVFQKSQTPNLSQNGSLPRPPPPVLLIQFPILLCVIALHEAVCPSTA